MVTYVSLLCEEIFLKKYNIHCRKQTVVCASVTCISRSTFLLPIRLQTD